MLAPLSRDVRRMAAIQLMRDGLFFRRWRAEPAAALNPAGNGANAKKPTDAWQPVCDTDPLDEFGIRP